MVNGTDDFEKRARNVQGSSFIWNRRVSRSGLLLADQAQSSAQHYLVLLLYDVGQAHRQLSRKASNWLSLFVVTSPFYAKRDSGSVISLRGHVAWRGHGSAPADAKDRQKD